MAQYAQSFLLLLVLAGLPCASAAAQETRLLGFSDINYLATERDVPGGFYSGQLAGHLAAGLSERLAFFAEVTATARSTGFAFEVERAMIRYDVGDWLKVSAGRYHTPINYWNAAYHHGLWLQTSIARPEMIKFGSHFLPVHFVGLLAEGTFPATPLGLGYFAGVGNGRHAIIARAGDAGDVNDRRSWLAGVVSRPQALFGLQTGVAFYLDRVPNALGQEVDEQIYAAHVVWEKETPEVVAEHAWVVHDPGRGGGRSVSRGTYVQLAYRLPGAARAFKPYVRGEYMDVPTGDPVFGPLDLGYAALVAGLRFDFAMLAALKAEYRYEDFETTGSFNSLYLQISFTFPGTFPGQ